MESSDYVAICPSEPLHCCLYGRHLLCCVWFLRQSNLCQHDSELCQLWHGFCWDFPQVYHLTSRRVYCLFHRNPNSTMEIPQPSHHPSLRHWLFLRVCSTNDWHSCCRLLACSSAQVEDSDLYSNTGIYWYFYGLNWSAFLAFCIAWAPAMRKSLPYPAL